MDTSRLTCLLLFFELYTGVSEVLWSQVNIVLHFNCGQGKQQMFFGQHSPAFSQLIPYKFLKSFGDWVVGFFQPNHVEPGYTFITQFMPTLIPYCFLKS